jgi:hypothetical protein
MPDKRDEGEAPIVGEMSRGGSLSTQMLFTHQHCPLPALRAYV